MLQPHADFFISNIPAMTAGIPLNSGRISRNPANRGPLGNLDEDLPRKRRCGLAAWSAANI